MVARDDMSAHATEGELAPAERRIRGQRRVGVSGTEEDQAARVRPGFVAGPRRTLARKVR